MKVLFIGKRFYTNRDALEERYGRIYQLPLHWARQGVEARLWLIDYHGRQREQRQDETLVVESTPVRGLAWMFRALGVVVDRVRGRAPTHIVASGDAYIGLLGWCLARLTGACFVFDVYDKYDEFGGYHKPFGWELFGFLIRNADRCWFASRPLLTKLGDEVRRDALVMNGVDTNRFKPMDKPLARQKMGLSETGPIVGYFGAISNERGIPDLIKAVQVLRQTGISAGLVLAGKIDPDISLDFQDICYIGNIAYENVPEALAALDVVAVPYRRSAFLDAASSVKFGEIMACKRPMVATRTPNLVENFPEQASQLKPYLVEPECPEALALAIKRQLDDKVVVEMPKGMGWSSIAATTLAAIKSCRCG